MVHAFDQGCMFPEVTQLRPHLPRASLQLAAHPHLVLQRALQLPRDGLQAAVLLHLGVQRRLQTAPRALLCQERLLKALVGRVLLLKRPLCLLQCVLQFRTLVLLPRQARRKDLVVVEKLLHLQLHAAPLLHRRGHVLRRHLGLGCQALHVPPLLLQLLRHLHHAVPHAAVLLHLKAQAILDFKVLLLYRLDAQRHCIPLPLHLDARHLLLLVVLRHLHGLPPQLLQLEVLYAHLPPPLDVLLVEPHQLAPQPSVLFHHLRQQLVLALGVL
mmetsp:Transcript_2238/g.7967  ORF Transcript_2238/g.7967 Transcript_2238/m.7967 type:complete len:271 (+) Transcript_2238:148-960(+)